MTKIYVVRHGQADSLGKNYDNLTELGHLQARRVGEYLNRMNVVFDYMACGNLVRQNQTIDGLRKPLIENFELPEPRIHEELNEFEGNMWKEIAQNIAKENSEFEELLHKYRKYQEAGDPKCKKLFQIIIQVILKEWVEGGHTDVYPFDTYHDKVISILEHIPLDAKNVLLATSATPVAILGGYSLQLPKNKYLPLMKVIHNTSFNVFQWDGEVLSPITINSYPHIQNPDEMSLM